MLSFKLNNFSLVFRFLFFCLLIVLDQLSKYFFSETICNPYISWGIPLHGKLLWLLITISLILLLYIVKIYSFRLSLILIVAGGVANLVDRLQNDCVTDFISIGNFPIFNLADIFITVGVIVFLWQEIFKRSN